MGLQRLVSAPRRSLVMVDEGVLPFRAEAVLRALADVESYREWWPAPLRFVAHPSGPAGDRARVRITAGRLLSWTVSVAAVGPDQVDAAFSEGSWDGEARWTLRPVTEGTAAVLRVEVDPVPRWLRLAVRWRNPTRRHSRRMRTVFEALRRRLGAQGEERVPEPGPPGAVTPAGSPSRPSV